MKPENYRQSERTEGFWKIYKLSSESDEEFELGYIFNLSDHGINLWINKRIETPNKDMSIRIYLPEDIPGEKIDLDIEIIYHKGRIGPYIEIGCSYKFLNNEKKIIIDKLQKYFNQIKKA